MCGIAGLISRTKQPVDRDLFNAMIALVSHRGPDGSGSFFHDSFALGHRRLSILDLTENGAQPMKCPYSSRVITYNGEVYNHLELRQQLEKNGYVFRSTSDTEVILAAYNHWGPLCVNHFNGMWAFALYDPSANILFCSRDRFGVKPFYYFVSDNIFAFGSEIRQLLQFIPRIQANSEVLIDFLFSGAIEHGEATFFAGINKLAASHNLVYNLDSHQFTIDRYYELKPCSDLDGIAIQDAMKMYRDTLSDAIKLRLRSDVPVATCLSGGLDSSSVATLASRLYSQNNHNRFTAITAISEDPTNDESKHARAVVEHSGLRWLTVKPSYEDFASTINDVALAQEEPFGSPSVSMQYFVMRTAKENGLPVLIDGQGGDETILGYERYFVAHFINIFKKIGFMKMIREMKAGARVNALMKPRTLLSYFLYFSNGHLRFWNYLYRNRYLLNNPSMPLHIKAYATANRDILDLQKYEIEQGSLQHLLRYEDKNSMWHSVEARLPFLDYRHVELALSLPWWAKINNGWTKYILRKSMSDMLPESIAWRRDKKGFDAPSGIWIPRHERIMNDAVLSSSLLRKVADTKKLKQTYVFLDHQTRWRLYSVALWERLFNVSSAP